MESINSIVNKRLVGFEMAFEFEFIDPNNQKLEWFNDLYKEGATFSEIYDRFAIHPNGVKNYSRSAIYEYLYSKDKDAMFEEMYDELGIGDHDPNVLKELASEIDKACSTKIKTVAMGDLPQLNDKNPFWSLGIDNRDILTLRSPFMDNIDAATMLDRVITGFIDSFFMGVEMKIYVRPTSNNPVSMNWFKGVVLFNFEAALDMLLTVPIQNRRHEANRLVNQMAPAEIHVFINEFLNKSKTTIVDISSQQVKATITREDNYVTTHHATISWFWKIMLIIKIVSDKEFCRTEYVDRLRQLIARSGIKR